MKYVITAICIMMSIVLFAQDSTMILIPAGHSLDEILTPDKIYEFPKFTAGKILFRDGTRSEARLNYNFLNGEIEFVSSENDTLAIAKTQMLSIKQVLIDTQSYIYKDGYLEMVLQSGSRRLYKRQQYAVIRREKIGGYNQPSSTTVIDSYGSYVDDRGNFYTNLKVRENITLALKTTYFIGDEYNFVLPASKGNMMSLFRSKRNEIKSYLNKNRVDFNNGEDLIKLLNSL